jgi:hypothetical protein
LVFVKSPLAPLFQRGEINKFKGYALLLFCSRFIATNSAEEAKRFRTKTKNRSGKTCKRFG